MTGRRHLRLVALGDDVDPPPTPADRRRRRRDRVLYERTLADLSRRGWHAAVAAIEAALIVERRHAADERQRRPESPT